MNSLSKLLISTTILISGMVNANDMSDYFKAVITSETLAQLSVEEAKEGYKLSEISHKVTYRCPGCFGFDITFNKFDASLGQLTSMHKIGTRLDRQGNINVGIDPQ